MFITRAIEKDTKYYNFVGDPGGHIRASALLVSYSKRGKHARLILLVVR
jgi:hypothetical protein